MTNCPNTDRCVRRTRPLPWQLAHVSGCVPGSARVPLHDVHCSVRLTSTSRSTPNAASSNVTLRLTRTSSPWRGRVRDAVPLPKNASKMSPKPPKMSKPSKPPAPCPAPLRTPAWPKRSYCWRRWGSLSTWYASLTSLKRSEASLALFRSGWYSIAFWRKALRMSSSDAWALTPSTS